MEIFRNKKKKAFFSDLQGLFIFKKWLPVVLSMLLITGCSSGLNKPEKERPGYLSVVQSFADSVLKNGHDTYGNTHSPLFVDGINADTGEPVRWIYLDKKWVISNFASQQNLLRVLDGLTQITGEKKYRRAAEEATQYMFDHYTDSQGLLHWGGHQFVDLESGETQFKGRPHELKTNFPYYEFLWQVDSAATRKMLRAMWNAHILDWRVLDLNRHGEYGTEMGRLWDHEFEKPPPFFESDGLTFINAGTDMIQAAMALYFLGNEEGAKTWGTRLFEMYVDARHPETGLGVYQYSQPVQEEKPPKEGPLTGELTFSRYGDRAQNQFGEKYGEVALEGNVLWGSRISRIYGQSAIMFLHIAEQLEGTETGKAFLNETLAGMKAYAEYAYLPEKNRLQPMWANGTILTGDTYPRTGDYGKKGDTFELYEPGGYIMLSYVRAARLSDGDPVLWNMVRHMFMGHDLGDPGETMTSIPEINRETAETNPDFLVAALEMYRLTGHEEYLALAECIADNILDKRYFGGYFKPSEEHVYTKFDRHEPLALLHLVATKQGVPEAAPTYLTGEGVTDGEAIVPGIDGRPSDELIYQMKKSDSVDSVSTRGEGYD